MKLTVAQRRENEDRAAAGKASVEACCNLRGSADDPESDLADTLTNLMHYAHEEKLAFHEQLSRARDHFDAELNEE